MEQNTIPMDINILISEIKSDIEEVYFMNELPWVIGYSGGKDSTCTTQIILETLIELKQKGKVLNKHIYIISSDTMVENPMIVNTIHNSINNLNKIAEEKKLPLSAHIIHPEFNNTFWSNLIGRGYPCPNQTFRWCTDRMKINPANQFITKIVNEHGEAIMVLGVRDGESNSRDRVLESHTIEGKKLMRHTTMSNAYVYAPIRKMTIDNIWEYLLNSPSPWGVNNYDLYKLYTESNGEDDYEMIFDEEQKRKQIGGNSRFGCWVCTVVSKDKSLSSFIEKGETWLIPLLEYRNWLYSIRDDENRRMRRRHDGSIYFSKVKLVSDNHIVIPAKGNRGKINIFCENGNWYDDNKKEWVLFEGPNCEELAKDYISKNMINLNDGSNPHILIKRINDEVAQLGPGPFTLETRVEMLTKLFELQKNIGDKYELFKMEELLAIRKLWFKYGVWEDLVSEKYFSVFGNELPGAINDDIKLFDENDLEILNKICIKKEVNPSLLIEIFNIEKQYMGYNNRSEVYKTLKKMLSKEFVHLANRSENNED